MHTVTVPVRTLVAAAVGAATALAAVLVVTAAWRVDALPGPNEATFVPIAPCRLADTRPAPDRVGAAAALGAGEIETFAATGAVGECSAVPANATAVSMNVTALGATQQTYLTVYPAGPPPLAASLNPAPGQPPVPNAVTTPLSGGAFRVYNDAGTVNVVIDLNGYYVKAGLQDLNARIVALENDVAAQPFVVQADGPAPGIDLPFGDLTTVVKLTVTAPAAGHVTAFSSASLIATASGGLGVSCSINDGPTADNSFDQGWKPGAATDSESIAGVRRFAVAQGESIVLHLVCRAFETSISVTDSVITGLFTPAP